MSDPWSWEVADHQERWDGYLIEPGSSALRNKVGARTVDELHAACYVASAERDDVAQELVGEAPV